MTRAGFVAAAGLVAAGLAAGSAVADVRRATIGNYYFEDEANGDRNMLAVQQGDQVTFTVREAAVTPHSVNIDELNIRSPDLLLFETYTTPPLDRVGDFRVYCRSHRDRGHQTTLVVRAAPAQPAPSPTTTAPPAPGRSPGRTTTTVRAMAGQPAPPAPPPTEGVAGPVPGSPSAASDASPATTLAPVGVGKAAPSDRRRPPPQAGSLADVLGRRPASEGPWTRAVRLAGVAGLGMALVAGAAVWQGSRRRLRPAATDEPAPGGEPVPEPAAAPATPAKKKAPAKRAAAKKAARRRPPPAGGKNSTS